VRPAILNLASLPHDYERDRDRIITRALFRRLETKNPSLQLRYSDIFGNADSHLGSDPDQPHGSKSLGLNLDLVGIGLGDDVSPPFGHAGPRKSSMS